MEEYIQNFENYKSIVVYDFNIGDGGIADCIKSFVWCLEKAIEEKHTLYYKINNIPIENYLKLIHTEMYVKDLSSLKNNFIYIIKSTDTYSHYNETHLKIKLNQIFQFSNDIINNSKVFLDKYNIPPKYISLHLRLGDKFLETDSKYVQCKEDTREYNHDTIDKFIKNNINDNIIFFCDNHKFKIDIVNKYKGRVFIINCNIGHTGLKNTTKEQILDTVTEFYIMSNSQKIISASYSGFPIIASKFNNVPIEYLY